MTAFRATQQTIQSCRPTLARHIHVNLHIRARRIVHYVGDMVVVRLCFPRLHQLFFPFPAICQWGDERFCLRNIHVKGRISHIGSTVKDESALYGIWWREAESEVVIDIHFLKLWEVHLLSATFLIVVSMAKEDASVSIERIGSKSSTCTIYLHVAVALISDIGTCLESIGTKTCPMQLQVKSTTDVTCSLRITVKARV